MHMDLTPAQRATRIRQLLGALRHCLNIVRTELQSWQGAHQQGATAAFLASNSILQEWNLERVNLGILLEDQQLLVSAEKKLQGRSISGLQALRCAQQALTTAHRRVREATTSLAAQQEDTYLELGNLSFRTIRTMFEDIEARMKRELNVKANIVHGFGELAGQRTNGVGQQMREVGTQVMQVYLTAWKLEAELDRPSVQTQLDMVQAGMM